MKETYCDTCLTLCKMSCQGWPFAATSVPPRTLTVSVHGVSGCQFQFDPAQISCCGDPGTPPGDPVQVGHGKCPGLNTTYTVYWDHSVATTGWWGSGQFEHLFSDYSDSCQWTGSSPTVCDFDDGNGPKYLRCTLDFLSLGQLRFQIQGSMTIHFVKDFSHGGLPYPSGLPIKCGNAYSLDANGYPIGLNGITIPWDHDDGGVCTGGPTGIAVLTW